MMLVVVAIPFGLWLYAVLAAPARGIAAATVGVVGSGLLLAWAYSPGPVHEGEPHLAGMYDAIAKYFVLMAAWPMLALFLLALGVRIFCRADDAPERVDLPRAVIVTEATPAADRGTGAGSEGSTFDP